FPLRRREPGLESANLVLRGLHRPRVEPDAARHCRTEGELVQVGRLRGVLRYAESLLVQLRQVDLAYRAAGVSRLLVPLGGLLEVRFPSKPAFKDFTNV